MSKRESYQSKLIPGWIRSDIDLGLTAPKPMLRICFIEGTVPMAVLKNWTPF